MKIVVIQEFDAPAHGDAFVLDLRAMQPKDCTGCWSCWLNTPGRCAWHDLDDFYRAFLAADQAHFYIRASRGFVSSSLKTLFDRMIPHYLPYITCKSGECMHEPRYERYPDVHVCYQGDFTSAEEQENFEDYLRRVFYQFYVPNTTIEFLAEAVNV